MIKFAVKLSVLFLAILISCFFLLYLLPGYNDGYMAASLDKHSRLENIKEPKIIFIGGSNLAFGLNSKMIEEHFNIKVVNMGLSRGLGVRFMVEEIRPYIKEGDIVVLAPGYPQFYGVTFEGRGSTIMNLLLLDISYLRYIKGMRQYIEIITNFTYSVPLELFLLQQDFFRKTARGDDLGPQRQGFNNYGDIICHLDKEFLPAKESMISPLPDDFNRDVIYFLNKFKIDASKNKIKVFFSFPSYAECAYNLNRNSILHLYKSLENTLDIEILGTPVDYVFADTMFAASANHLNGIGRELRTKKIIKFLEEKI